MRVICPHTNSLAPETVTSLKRYAPETEFAEVDGLYGYGELIAAMWDGSDDLVIVEQDNEITAEVIPSFDQCDKPWCVYEYQMYPEPYTRMINTGLGCTRFSVEAQKAIGVDEFIRPDYDWFPRCQLCGGKGCWLYLDSRISLALACKGLENHIHGEIPHHHNYPDSDVWIGNIKRNFVAELENSRG